MQDRGAVGTWELHDGGAQVGPLDEDHVVRMLLHGLPDGTVCRRVGETEWRSFRTHAPFAAALERKAAQAHAPAPPPPASAPEVPAQPVAPATIAVPAPAPRPRRKLVLWGAGLGGALLVLVLGVCSAVGGGSRSCRDNFAEAKRAADASDWERVRSALFQAKSFCGTHYADDIAAIEYRLKDHDDRIAADRERVAAERFPSQADDVRTAVKMAHSLITVGDLQDGAPRVKKARSMLDEYRGTSIEKGAEWRELDAQVAELERDVKPYVDKMNATLAQAQRELAAEGAEDRRAGVKLTREGYIASVSLEKLQKAAMYATAGDREGLALLVRNDPEVTMLREGVRVVPFERSGAAGSYVHVRVKGTQAEFWTLKDALSDP